ncbi:MAG: hypothetical protein NT061_04875, partial [Spirochaetes bacterium]|nr:hypothetical protein [Spirochaetota bacterium]
SCILIDFSGNFGTLSGASFLVKLEAAGVGFISIGPNFRCGHKMDTNAQRLVELAAPLGMEVVIVEPLLYAGHPVSSSRIRNAILEGRLGEAAAMLGRPYVLELGTGWTSMGGFWKAEPAGLALLPPEGTYRVVLEGRADRISCEGTVIGGSVILGSDPLGLGRLAFLELVSRE